MSSNLNDPTKWRLKTTGGIPYKLLQQEGDFGLEQADVTVDVLVQASDLLNFFLEMMPPPIQVGNVSVPQSSTLPGFPQISVKRIKFKSHDAAFPIDPFGIDSSPPDNTYYPVVLCQLFYSSEMKNRDTDEDDPQTFLEITSRAGGEFINSTGPGARWKPEQNSLLEDGDDQEPGTWIDPDTGKVLGANEENPRSPNEQVNRDPGLPILIRVPTTQWTLRWNQIPFELYEDVIVYRCRQLIGRVNSGTFDVPLFNTLEPETLLFDSYGHTQRHTWRDGLVTTPPVDLEINLIEKRVVWNGVVCGHNHFWRPGFGWQRLYIDDQQTPVYKGWDFNLLTQV